MNKRPAEYESETRPPVPLTTRRAPYLAAATEIPKFKRKNRDPGGPRYAPVMGLAWFGALVIVLINLVKGINGPDPKVWYWHFIADAGVALALLAAVSSLWAAWEREERFPELLPKREFDRRYPPSSAAPPAPSETRQFHRQIPYDGQTTMTGGQKLNENGAAAIPKVMSSEPPPPPPPARGWKPQ